MAEPTAHPFESLERPRKRSRAWLVLPLLGFGLLIASLIVLWWEPPPQQSVSEVTRGFRDIALAKSPKPGLDDGGAIGPWWITAGDVDPVTGLYHNMHVRSGNVLIAAEAARLVVDPATDTFQFELHNVVFTRVPDPDDPDDSELEHHVLELEFHTLGPVPFGIDIVPDHNAAVISLTGRTTGLIDLTNN